MSLSVILAGCFIFVFLAIIIYYYRFLSMLSGIMNTIENAEKNNFNINFDPFSSGEMKKLSASLNSMVQKLKELHLENLAYEKDFLRLQAELRTESEFKILNSELESRLREKLKIQSALEGLMEEASTKDINMEKHQAKLKLLNRISAAFSSAFNINELIKTIVEEAVSILKAKNGSLMLINGTEFLTIRYAVGLDETIVNNTKVKVGEGISGWVAGRGEPLLVQDIELDMRFKSIARPDYEAKSLISVPVKIKNVVKGVLNINTKIDGTEFNEEDLDLLVTLAGQTAIALENVRLYDDLQKSYFTTIRALVNTIEAKDSYTRGHSERVTKISQFIADAMNFSEKQKAVLSHAAVLHDIGKIGTSIDILNKKSKLAYEEYALIKEHPRIAMEILEPVDFLGEVKLVISEHHERVDGCGYPFGKARNETSIESRVLAVADAYDAMTSDRPYRKAMSKEEAVQELMRCAGTQFDSDIVNASVMLFSADNFNEI